MSKPGDGALRILIQFLRAQKADDPHAFRFEPQDYIVPTPGGESPIARFEWTQEFLNDLRAVRLPNRDPTILRRVGAKLRKFVKDAGWSEHERKIEHVLATGRRVFLTLRSSAAELYALPWELLTFRSGRSIGEEDRLLLRFEWPESQSAEERPNPRLEGGRILVAWSAATGKTVPASAHIEAIATACAQGNISFDRQTDVLPHASLKRIAEALDEAQAKEPIAALHILCHGGAVGSAFGLCLDGENGQTVVDAAQVRKQLEPFASMVRLVVISACDSANPGELGNHLGSLAQELHRGGFQSVIASRFPLSVSGSIQLAETFYSQLLSGPTSLESAFLATRKRMARDETSLPRNQQRRDWASLQLYAHHDDGDDTRPLVFRPYRGLFAFEPQHQRFFFGRDQEVQQIVTTLQALIAKSKERFLVVAGASGTGKSSLVFAGAVPRLLQADPQLGFLRMRPGRDPDRVLSELLSRQPIVKPTLLVVDQFEEIFTQTALAEERAAFVRRLWELSSAPEPGLRILVTLRVDFIGRCGELVLNKAGLRLDQIAYSEGYRVFVAQLKLEQLHAAIVEPARAVGLELPRGLINRMLADVGAEPGALPLLEDALDTLWQRRRGRLLSQSVYDTLGGVAGALQKRADKILTSLTEAEQLIARQLLLSLVSVADETAVDTRLRMPAVELRQTLAVTEPARFERVLGGFVRERLLVLDGDAQAVTVEVAHEALIRSWTKLRTWIDEDRAGLLMQRRVQQAAKHWAAQKQDESLLYRGTQLDQAADWRKTWEGRLGRQERSFLDASEALRLAEKRQAEERLRRERQRARQTRIAAVVLGVFFVAALGAGSVAYRNGIEAEKSASKAQKSADEVKQKSKESHANMLVAVAQNLKEDPTSVAALLREAGAQNSPLWIQSAIDALQVGVADIVLRGHESVVHAAVFSPDGKKILTGSGDKTARLWNADGSDDSVVFKRLGSNVTAVAFSPDGTKILIGCRDNSVQLWSADGFGGPVVFKGHADSVFAVAFSPDGKRVLTGSGDGTAQVWNADGSGKPVVLKGRRAYIAAVAFSPDGKKVLIGGGDETLRIWNADGSGEPAVLSGHLRSVTSVAFSPDGKKLLSGSKDNTALLWNADGSGEPFPLKGHELFVSSVAFSPDGKKILTGSWDRTARVWNADGSGIPVVLTGHAATVSSVAFSPDGKKILTGSDDGTVRIWNAEGSDVPLVLRGHEATVSSVAFSPDGKHLVTSSEDMTARVWKVDGSGDPAVLRGHEFPITSATFSADGRKVFTASRENAVRIWSADSFAASVMIQRPQLAVSPVAFSPDGRKVAAGGVNKTVLIWSTDDPGIAIGFDVYEETISALAISLDGKLVVTGSQEKAARVWNTDGGSEVAVLRGHEYGVSAVAISSDGKRVVTGSQDKTARVWSADGSGDPLVLKGHEGYIPAVAMSLDGKKVVTGSWDRTARIWDADESSAPVVLKGHAATVSAVAFSADRQRVATGSEDKTARIWPVSSELLVEALWSATSNCLPQKRRRELLAESFADAQQRYELCRQEVARRRGWRVPPAL